MSAAPVRTWLVDAARRIEAALGPSRVRCLALPPVLDAPGKEGEFCAVQLDDGSVGLSFEWGGASRKVTLTPERHPGLDRLLEVASRAA
jgi:hypothetical protein